MKLILFLSILLLQINIFADYQRIESRSLQFDTLTEYADKLEMQQKEIESLINRVELLEHSLAKLQKNISETTERLTNNHNVSKDKIDISESASRAQTDAFDIEMLKELNVQADPQVLPNNTAPANDKEAYDLALAAFKDNKLELADEKFSYFLKNYSSSSLVGNAYFWYGETFFKRANFDQAAINYIKCYNYPSSPKAPDALFKLSLALGELKKTNEACDILDRLESEFPTRSADSINKSRAAKMKFRCKSSLTK